MVLNRRGSKNREKKIERCGGREGEKKRHNNARLMRPCALECNINSCAISHSLCHGEPRITNQPAELSVRIITRVCLCCACVCVCVLVRRSRGGKKANKLI